MYFPLLMGVENFKTVSQRNNFIKTKKLLLFIFITRLLNLKLIHRFYEILRLTGETEK